MTLPFTLTPIPEEPHTPRQNAALRAMASLRPRFSISALMASITGFEPFKWQELPTQIAISIRSSISFFVGVPRDLGHVGDEGFPSFRRRALVLVSEAA